MAAVDASHCLRRPARTSTTLSPTWLVVFSPPRSLVRNPCPPAFSSSNTILTASSTCLASFSRPNEYRSMSAIERMVPIGLAMFWPAMSGAEPWMGSYSPGMREAPSGMPPSEADGRRPSEPGMTDVSSERMSPNKFSAAGRRAVSLGEMRRSSKKKSTRERTEDDAVQLPRVGADEHGGRVDELVVELEVRVLLVKRFLDDPTPQPRSREDVGLVDRVDGEWRVGAFREVRGEAGDALDFGDRVGARVERFGVAALGRARDGLAAVAKVDAADQFADDDNLGPLGDVLLEGRVGDEGRGREEGGADVGVEAEGFAEREEANLGTQRRVGSPFRTADGTCSGGGGGQGVCGTGC